MVCMPRKRPRVRRSSGSVVLESLAIPFDASTFLSDEAVRQRGSSCRRRRRR